MRTFLLSFLLLLPLLINAQGEAANWYFGVNAGLQFDINTGVPTPLTNGQLVTNEGCSSISDPSGNLLFYTDGITVYDANHNIMPNGTGLHGNPTSTQSAIIVPLPGDITQYFIFTVGFPDGGPDLGLKYSRVDMTLNGGLGDVVPGQKNIQLLADCSEKVTAVSHATNAEFWVIAYGNINQTGNNFNTYYVYNVSAAGVNMTPIVNTFTNAANDRRGYLKLSVDGQKMASANATSGLFLYDFNRTTGVVSNEEFIFIPPPAENPYGVEFSPNNRYLYVSTWQSSNNAQGNLQEDVLYQLDLQNPNISSSIVELHRGDEYRAGLQLGIDGKIYRTRAVNFDVGLPFLGVINNPDQAGLASNYVHDGIALPAPTLSMQGLPPFITTFFATIEVEFTCLGDFTEFRINTSEVPDAVSWDFGDGSTSTQLEPTHQYAAPGIYTVSLTINNNGIPPRTFTRDIEIFEVPSAFPVDDVLLCDDDNDGVVEVDLDSFSIDVLDNQDPNQFNVTYHPTQLDADDGTNAFAAFTNFNLGITNVFARIRNVDNQNCFDTTSFSISIFEQPVANPVNDLMLCDDNNDGDDTNGIVSIDLTQKNPEVLATQNPADFSITYHISQSDADNGLNALPTLYTNAIPGGETIFVRIENVLFTECFDTASFDVIIDPLPTANDATLVQCDDDILDGFTLFNLTEAEADINNLGGVNFSYFETLSDAENNLNALNAVNFSNVSNPQILFVRVEDNNTGCFRVSSLTVSVSTTTANDAFLGVCDDDTDGFVDFNLSNANAQVLNGLPANLNVSYYLTQNDALLEVNPLGSPFTNTQIDGQIIFARVEDDNACFGISEVVLEVFPLPDIELEADAIYCLNSFPDTIRLSPGILSGSQNDFTYLWNTGATTAEIDINAPGIYSVTVTDTNGCSRARTITVEPSNIATFINVTRDMQISGRTGSIDFDVIGEGDYEFALNDINGPYQNFSEFSDLEPGLYTIYARDKNGCGISSIEVGIISFPRFFTPNADGFNDTWQVGGLNPLLDANTEIYIFDRFGKLLKQLNPNGPGWDGTYNGNPLPSSDYWFSVRLVNGRVFKNHFTLKR